MPIHLPPISRRQFLARALAAGAGLALSPRLFATSRRTNANAWALLADTHVAADTAKLARGINMAEHLKTVSRDVLTLPQRPAGVFVTGDCAYSSGESGDYAAFTELLDPMRHDQLPIHIALGNHDHRERFWKGLRETINPRRPIADKHVAMLSTPRANWFVLDSLETTLSTPGLLGQEQLDWLTRALNANQDKPALILVHHNPEQLKDAEALYEIIRPRKQVKAYIFGHTHVWSVRQDISGIHFINLPAVAYVFRETEPSGWVHTNLERNGVKMELRCVNTSHPLHGKVTELAWRGM